MILSSCSKRSNEAASTTEVAQRLLGGEAAIRQEQQCNRETNAADPTALTTTTKAQEDDARHKAPKQEQEAQKQEQSSGDGEVKIIGQNTEWDGLDSDEEDDDHHEEVYCARERRLTAGEQALKQGMAIGDVDVEVVPQTKEWTELEDSDEDNGTKEFDTHAVETFKARERRLTFGEEMLKLEKTLGDADVEVVAHNKEWSGYEDSENEDEGQKLDHHATQKYQARERRLSYGAEALKLEKTLGDVDVEVLSEKKEWAGGQDSDDENDDPQLDQLASEAFAAREKRLTLGAEMLKLEKSLGDTDVEVVTQNQEWAGLEDSDKENGDENIDRHLQEICQARERRFTRGEEALKQEMLLGDADVEVVVQTTEWAGNEDSEEEDGTKVLDHHAAETYNARERRLTVGEEVLKQGMLLGDADVEVVTQSTEWAGHNDSDEDENCEQMDRHASDTYEAREKRLTLGAEALKQVAQLNDESTKDAMAETTQ